MYNPCLFVIAYYIVTKIMNSNSKILGPWASDTKYVKVLGEIIGQWNLKTFLVNV